MHWLTYPVVLIIALWQRFFGKDDDPRDPDSDTVEKHPCDRRDD